MLLRVYEAVADPDLQIRGAGGEADHPDPEITGAPGLPKNVFRPSRLSLL